MFRREYATILLGVIGAILLVAYPLAYRLTTEGASSDVAATGPSASPVASAPPIPALTVAPTMAPEAIELPPPESPWMAVAMEHRGANGRVFDYECPPDGTLGVVWGSHTFTDDSSVCTAGVHEGVITREDGGMVRIVIQPALASYEGSTQNGVTTQPYGPWDGSFVVITMLGR